MSAELKLYEVRYCVDRRAAADRLRRIADRIAQGKFKVGGHLVRLPPELQCEIEMEGDASSGQIEFEIGWRAWDGMGPTRY